MLGLGLSIPCAAVRGNVSLEAQVAAILRKYGTDAHLYLPGIGIINGLTAGNYLDSAGTTAATVGNPVGLVLDAAGSVGSELITQPIDFATWGTVGILSTVTANSFTNTSGSPAGKNIGTFVTTKTYLYSLTYTKSDASTLFGMYASGGGTPLATSTAAEGTLTVRMAPGANGPLYLRLAGNATVTVTNVSVKEVTGIHAIQATSANKMILRSTSGRYWWDAADGTDLLSITFPAGYESSTTVDAALTGQATLTAQNIVGAYAINTDTYGRFVFKNITASELAVIQSYCNRLAGL